MSLFDVGDGLAPRFPRFKQIFQMASNRRGDVLFQVLLGLVFRILLQFVSHVLVHRLLAMTPPPGLPRPAGEPSARPQRPVLLRPVPVAAAASSLVLAGLAAAAFLAGGGAVPPAPTVTPAVDVFMIQHVITPGTAPSGPAPSPSPLTGTRAP